MSTQIDLSPRERMYMAKMALLEAEKEERVKYKQAQRESKRMNQVASFNNSNDRYTRIEPVASSSKSQSPIRPSSILRKSSIPIQPPSSYQSPSFSNTLPIPTKTTEIPCSPAPSLPLPPAPSAPKLSQNTDFGPPIDLPSPSSAAESSSNNSLRRRSSRVRFSDQQIQNNLNPNQLLMVSRSTSMKSLRRESSIDGLRSDLIKASNSLNSSSSKRSSIVSNQSLSRRISIASMNEGKRSSIASSINSDPFNWTTSSVSISDIDINSEIDLGSRKQSLYTLFPEPEQEQTLHFDFNTDTTNLMLENEIELEINEEELNGFKPQILPYPKISKALSRLSIESTNSSIWLTQNHMINNYNNADNNSLYSINSNKLERSLSLASSSSSFSSNNFHLNLDLDLDLNDSLDSRKSSQFSLELEAKINSPTATKFDSRKSSYTPSSFSATSNTPASLRSSTSENEIQENIKHILSVKQIHSSPYSTLLPTRRDRRRSSLLSNILIPENRNGNGNDSSHFHLPNLNRGEWIDSEMNLSPRSNPIKYSTISSSTTTRRRSTKLAEEIILQSSPEIEQYLQDEKKENISLISSNPQDRQDSRDLLSTASLQQVPPVPDNQVIKEETPIIAIAYKGHTRSESTFSAIMAFPIPPDRIIEAEPEAVAKNTTEIGEFNIEDSEETPKAEKLIRLSSRPEVQCEVQQQVEPKEVCLNSPFLETFPFVNSSFPQALTLETPPPIGAITMVEEIGADDHIPSASQGESSLESLLCPSSPEIKEVLLSVKRPKRVVRRYSAPINGNASDSETETEESDLDVASPLFKVALKSKILTPRSRLLSPSSKPTRPSSTRSVSANSILTTSPLSSGLGLTSGKGWSGSESEEEDWISTIKEIKQRKLDRKSKSPKTPSVMSDGSFESKKGKRKSESLTIQIKLANTHEEFGNNGEDCTPKIDKNNNRLSVSSITSTSTISSLSSSDKKNRYSQLSILSNQTTDTNTSLTTDSIDEIEQLPLTPTSINGGLTRTNSNISLSSSLSSNQQQQQPGNFPWGLSSPPNSPIRGLFLNNNLSPTKAFFTSFRDENRNFEKKSKNNNKNREYGKMNLPKPTREEIDDECWGEPEILIDERRTSFTGISESDEDEDEDENGYQHVINRSLRELISNMSLLKSDPSERYCRRSTIKISSLTDIEKEKENLTPTLNSNSNERCQSPDLWINNDDEDEQGETSLMEEGMPDL